jgi:LEA14-like dessication related protein
VRHTSAVLSLLLIALLLAGCQGRLADLLAAAPKPTASIEGISFKDISLDRVNLVANVKVTNPYPVPIYAKQVGFNLLSEQTSLLSGQSDQPLNVAAKSTGTIPVALELPFAAVLGKLQGVRLGQVIPLTTKLDLSLAGENVQALNFQVEKSGELPVPAPPEVKVNGLAWKKLGLSQALGEVGLSIRNTNEFPINLSAMDYKLKLGGREVSAGALAGKALELAPGESGDLAIEVGLIPQTLGLAAFGMLSGKSAPFELNGLVSTETPFGPMKLDFARSGALAMSR